jgi:nucleotide-binding universal stress UspA family protein
VGTPEEALLAEDRGKLLDTLANLDVKPNTPITSELLAGSAADGLCEAAELRRASLLIASTMGRSGAFFGGTIERVVRSVRVPVLAIRAPEHLESWLERNVTLRVMIGSDLGLAARNAEAFVALLDRAGPLEVQVVCVAQPVVAHARYDLPAPTDLNQLDPTAEQLLLRDLEHQGAPFAWNARRRASVTTGTSSAASHLSVLAQNAHLVIAGLRTHSWLGRLWHGSTAAGLLRSAPVSVVCVPRGVSAPLVQRVARAKVVVACTDFSEIGDEAVLAAIGMVEPGATLHVVHVLPVGLDREPEARTVARNHLRQRVPQDAAGRDIQAEVLVGEPIPSIVGFARRVGADLICVGSHGRTGLGALALGSTSHGLLAVAEVPVLVVPPIPA